MKKILFVEDDIQTQKIYTEKFSKEFEVMIAPTGAEGIHMAVHKKPDVIVLDIILGGNMNGFDVLREMKLNPVSKKIPVIVLTNLESQEQASRDGGAVACVIKANTSIEKIGETIRKYV